jgi:Xaa-Pro aminopeptidase
MTSTEKLLTLRTLMSQYGFAAYIIPSTDPHQSEYIGDHWKTRQWFCGFSGSAGTVVVTQNFAGLWTDSRYFIQAEKELHGSGIELVKLHTPHTPEFIDWINENIEPGSTVGIDAQVISEALVKLMKERFAHNGIKLNCGLDLPGMMWTDRPAISTNKIYEHELSFAGKSRSQKLELVRKEMETAQVDIHLLTSLDDIAWLFNLRGTDVDFNPVFISYALITHDSAILFINEKKLTPDLKQKLISENIDIEPYEAIGTYLSKLPHGKSILYSSGKTSHNIYMSIPLLCKKVDSMSIPARLKACKDAKEIQHFRDAMVKDGVALVKFFRWLEQNIGKEIITEITVDEVLSSFRAYESGFTGNSFGTIAGYKDHGAIIHYDATPETAYIIKSEGLLLIDSGAQYVDGTTDITRTITLGKPSEEEILDYTLVLKGLIQLSLAIFPQGTKGFHLDILARKALWAKSRNYGHGTGHGVGYFLNVHEGPQGITPNAAVNIDLTEGMIQSNEPGLYREGKYGIRLENLILVTSHSESQYGKFFQFETLTLYPFENKLIDYSLLIPEEKAWLKNYHKTVYEKLSPRLNEEEKQWLLEKTS